MRSPKPLQNPNLYRVETGDQLPRYVVAHMIAEVPALIHGVNVLSITYIGQVKISQYVIEQAVKNLTEIE